MKIKETETAGSWPAAGRGAPGGAAQSHQQFITDALPCQAIPDPALRDLDYESYWRLCCPLLLAQAAEYNGGGRCG
jgi:hypothetical protein